MSNGRKNNFGARLLVILLAAGVVALGLYPIRKRYGGAQGLLNKVLPQSVVAALPTSLPSLHSMRAYLESFRHEGNSGQQVAKEAETAAKAAEEAPKTGEQRSFVSRLFGVLGEDPHAKSTDRELARSPAASHDRASERAQLGSPEKPKPKEMDRLSKKDRKELDQLIDGF